MPRMLGEGLADAADGAPIVRRIWTGNEMDVDDYDDDVQAHAKTHQPAQSFNAYILRFPKVRPKHVDAIAKRMERKDVRENELETRPGPFNTIENEGGSIICNETRWNGSCQMEESSGS